MCDSRSIELAHARIKVVRPSFAYSLFVHSFHARRDRVVLLPPCRLYGAATLRPTPLGPGRGLTLPCGWSNAAQFGRAAPAASGFSRGPACHRPVLAFEYPPEH